MLHCTCFNASVCKLILHNNATVSTGKRCRKQGVLREEHLQESNYTTYPSPPVIALVIQPPLSNSHSLTEDKSLHPLFEGNYPKQRTGS